jgi:hypothetical protein
VRDGEHLPTSSTVSLATDALPRYGFERARLPGFFFGTRKIGTVFAMTEGLRVSKDEYSWKLKILTARIYLPRTVDLDLDVER